LASSTASSITTDDGVPRLAQELVHGQAEDVLVDGGDAVEAPVLARARDLLVQAPTSFWAPAGQALAMARVSSVLVRTCQKRPATRSMGSRVMSHW
jgi:hypothetical protein